VQFALPFPTMDATVFRRGSFGHVFVEQSTTSAAQGPAWR